MPPAVKSEAKPKQNNPKGSLWFQRLHTHASPRGGKVLSSAPSKGGVRPGKLTNLSIGLVRGQR